MGLVVMVNAAGGKDGAVDAGEEAAVGQVEGADHIGPDRFLLVVLAPVDIGTPRGPGAVQHMSGLDLV